MKDKNTEPGMRADLSLLTDMAQKSETQEVSKKKKNKKKETQDNNNPRSTNDKRIPQDENFSKSPRIKRYKLFRNLGKGQVPVEKKTPKKEATETF